MECGNDPNRLFIKAKMSIRVLDVFSLEFLDHYSDLSCNRSVEVPLFKNSFNGLNCLDMDKTILYNTHLEKLVY